MIETDYAFNQRILPIGTSGATDVLLRFRIPSSGKPRRKLNLALVIDRSGSMAGSALSHALKAAQAVIDSLEPTDMISVVAFDDHVTTVIAPQLATDPKALKEKVRGIRAGGTTNLSGGWLEGCKHIKSHYDPQAINRVLLLTDGHANEGITDAKILTKTATQKLEEGIITTTLGFGSGFEEDLLIGMARAASGNFYFIQNTEDAAQVFKIELETMKSVLAQNLMVNLELRGGAKLSHTLSLAKVSEKDGVSSITLGDIFDGEDKLLGLTLDLPELNAGQLEVCKATFSADAIEDDTIKSVTGEILVQVQAGSIEEAASAAPTGVRVELARLKIAKAKDMALEQTDQNKYTEAEKTLRNVMDEIRKQGLHENYEIAEELEQLEYFAARASNKNISSDTRKELRDQSFQGLSRNRSDLAGRGVETSDEVRNLSVVSEAGTGIEVQCVRENGKLKIKVGDPAYDSSMNVQFPRAIRAEGVKYIVESLERSNDGTFYRAVGKISRLVKAGEADTFSAPQRSKRVSTGKASSAPATAADLEVTSDTTDAVLIQCVKEGSKLRARVVSDGYEPTWNMRFPRSIREDGMLYVVDEVMTAPDGKSYIACGKIKRFEQV
jgi:Ca-activated chloride channel homolog